MSRCLFLFAGVLFGLSLTTAAFGQAGAQPRQRNNDLPQFDGSPEDLQRELDKLRQDMQRELEKARANMDNIQKQLNRGRWANGAAGTSAAPVKWGGVGLAMVTRTVQEQLGLPENEGMIVTAVEPNSPGEKAGLKANDVLAKINDAAVPGEFSQFAKLLKEQKPDAELNLVVVRKGKEETLKGIKMPALVQANPTGAGFRGQPNVMVLPRLQMNLGRLAQPMAFPFGGQGFENLHMDMNMNGARIVRRQTQDQFSGEYSKGELKITLNGKLDRGQPTVSEITVQEGKDTKKYTKLNEVPPAARTIIQQSLLPTSGNVMMMNPFDVFPMMPNFPGFPGFPDDF